MLEILHSQETIECEKKKQNKMEKEESKIDTKTECADWA